VLLWDMHPVVIAIVVSVSAAGKCWVLIVCIQDALKLEMCSGSDRIGVDRELLLHVFAPTCVRHNMVQPLHQLTGPIVGNIARGDTSLYVGMQHTIQQITVSCSVDQLIPILNSPIQPMHLNRVPATFKVSGQARAAAFHPEAAFVGGGLVALKGATREPVSAKEMSAPHLTAITTRSTGNDVKQVSCEQGVPFNVQLVQAAVNARLGFNHAAKSVLQGGPDVLAAIQHNNNNNNNNNISGYKNASLWHNLSRKKIENINSK